MKKKSTSPEIYYWSQAKDAADKLATWAYCNLIKPESPRAKAYPLEGAKSMLLLDGSWGLILPETAPSKEIAESIQTSPRPVEILEPSNVRRQLEEIAVVLQEASNFSKGYYSTDFISKGLCDAIDKANKLLAELAGTNKWSAERFWLSTLRAVMELENLSARADALPALQAVACKQTMWPVIYRQNKEGQSALKKEMELLGLGSRTIHKIGRTNRNSPSGKFARRIGQTLWRIHFDGNLRQCLHRHAVAPLTPKGEIALDANLYKVERKKGLLKRTPDADSPQKWEVRLITQGWPRWVVKLVQLPELTADNANDWFDVGWEALKEAMGSDVIQNPELAALGKSNAKWWANKHATTKRGKVGFQRSRAERQVEKLLRNAFVARFGNAPNFNTKRSLKSP